MVAKAKEDPHIIPFFGTEKVRDALKRTYPRIKIEGINRDVFKITNAKDLPDLPPKRPLQSSGPAMPSNENAERMREMVQEILLIAKSDPEQRFIVSSNVLDELRETDPHIEIRTEGISLNNPWSFERDRCAFRITFPEGWVGASSVADDAEPGGKPASPSGAQGSGDPTTGPEKEEGDLSKLLSVAGAHKGGTGFEAGNSGEGSVTPPSAGGVGQGGGPAAALEKGEDDELLKPPPASKGSPREMVVQAAADPSTKFCLRPETFQALFAAMEGIPSGLVVNSVGFPHGMIEFRITNAKDILKHLPPEGVPSLPPPTYAYRDPESDRTYQIGELFNTGPDTWMIVEGINTIRPATPLERDAFLKGKRK